MAASYEKGIIEYKSYHLTIEDIQSLEFGEFLIKDSSIKLTSMTADMALLKAKYLKANNFELPENWFVKSAEEASDLKLNDEFLPCIHVLYGLVARAEKLSILQYYLTNGTISLEDAKKVLNAVNFWLNGRLETENCYRERIVIAGQNINIEKFFRVADGIAVNPDQYVSEDELNQVISIFKNRFTKK